MSLSTVTLQVPKGMRQPQPVNYFNALGKIGKLRPRNYDDTWTEQDAAKWWWPEYDPTAPNPLPASMVMAVVARVFVGMTRFVAPLRRGWKTIAEKSNPIVLCTDWPGMTLLLHEAYHANNSSGTVADGVAIRQLEMDSVSYCLRKTRKSHRDCLRGCIGVRDYTVLRDCGMLVPWHEVRTDGMTALFTPLKMATEAPYVSVRKERSHTEATYVPYHVASRINDWSRIIPAMLQQPWIFNAIKRDIVSYLKHLRDERLRFYALATMNGDVGTAMYNWDKAFTDSAWLFGCRDDDTYSSFETNYWCVDGETHRSLIDTEPTDLFPKIRDTKFST